MIASIHLKNFQSHKDTYMEFDPGVNVIVGSSDSGKTAIIRALYWVINNKPDGAAFCSHWGGPTEVIIKAAGPPGQAPVEIKRLRTKTKNEYHMGGEVFKAFGHGVPEPIRKALALGAINMQRQLDKHFLISNTAGEVAQTLNETVNLNIIDEAQAGVAKRIRNIQQDIKTEEQRGEELAEELKGYEYIGRAEALIQGLEGKEAAKNAVVAEIASLGAKISELAVNHKALKNTHETLKYIDRIVVLENKAMAVTGVGEKRGALTRLLEQIHKAERRARNAGHLLPAEEKVNTLLKETPHIKELIHRGASLEGFILNILQKQKTLKAIETELNGLTTEFNKLMPDVCPLCGRGSK
jgi:DNA repair exonuclease SbcCD ATPase subunit